MMRDPTLDEATGPTTNDFPPTNQIYRLKQRPPMGEKNCGRPSPSLSLPGIHLYMYRFPFAGRYGFRLLGCLDLKKSTVSGPFVFVGAQNVIGCYLASPPHPTSECLPRGTLYVSDTKIDCPDQSSFSRERKVHL